MYILVFPWHDRVPFPCYYCIHVLLFLCPLPCPCLVVLFSLVYWKCFVDTILKLRPQYLIKTSFELPGVVCISFSTCLFSYGTLIVNHGFSQQHSYPSRLCPFPGDSLYPCSTFKLQFIILQCILWSLLLMPKYLIEFSNWFSPFHCIDKQWWRWGWNMPLLHWIIVLALCKYYCLLNSINCLV